MLTDEAEPLLSTNQRGGANDGAHSKGAILVEFDNRGDDENPREWSKGYKRGVVALLALMAFTTTFTCISVVPVANRIVKDLNHDDHPDKTDAVLLVTIWELGEAAGPLLLGPLSELFGRRIVLNAAMLMFIASTVLSACCQSTNLFVGARFLTGLSVASNVLSPAIVGDIYLPEHRGSAMSLVMLAPLFGGTVGPVAAGAIAESFGWRPVIWLSAALAIACEVVFLCCFRETYSVVILRRRAAALQCETGNTNFRTKFDIDNDQEASQDNFWTSIARPFRVLYGSYVLQAISVYGSLTYTYFYIMSTTLPDILEDIYYLSPSSVGLCFIAFSVGDVIAVVICNRYLDRIYVRLRDKHEGIDQPEYRLPLVIFGSLTIPIAVAAYGWVPYFQLPLPFMLIACSLLGATMMFGFLPVTSYVVDALGPYSASGMTAMIVIRCLAGTFFPLSVEPLVEKIDYGWAFTVLASISVALAPIPILIFRYGHTWRSRSPYMRGSSDSK